MAPANQKQKIVSSWLRPGLRRYRWYFFWIPLSCLIVTIHYQGVYYKHDAPKWWLLDLALATFVAFKVVNQRVFDGRLASILAAGFLLLCGISVLWAPNKAAAVELFLRFFIFSLALYHLSIDIRSVRYQNLPYMVAIFSSATFFSVLLFERHVLGLAYSNANYSPLGFINHAGHVYVIWIPLLFWGAISYSGIRRWFSAVFLVASCWILSESAIRASMLGLAGACLTLALILTFVNRKNVWQPIALLLVFVGVVFATQQMGQKSDYLTNKLVRTVMADSLNTATSYRVHLFGNTIEMVADNPLGVGLAGFEFVHPLYAKAGTAQASPFVSEKHILRTPHNFFLKAASETGWLGGLLALSLSVLAASLAWRGLKAVSPWSCAYFVALLAVLFNSLFSAVFNNPGSLWFSLLLFAGVAGSAPRGRPLLRAPLSATTKLVALAACVGLMAVSSTSLVSQMLAHKGKLDSDPLKLERAVQIWPGNERGLYDLAVIRFEQSRDVSGAIKTMRRFLRLYPYHITGRYKLSQWLCLQQDYANCRAELEILLRFYPKFKAAQALHNKASAAERGSLSH